MNQNFSKETLEINLSREIDNTISIEVSSDFAFSNRKNKLSVNEDKIRHQVEQFWKSFRTDKPLSMSVYFDEIDSYDDEVDVYTTPSYHVDRENKKVVVEHTAHGSVPKDWAIVVKLKIADTATKTSILSVLEKMLVHNFPTDGKVEIINKLKPFLLKEENHICYCNE